MAKKFIVFKETTAKSKTLNGLLTTNENDELTVLGESGETMTLTEFFKSFAESNISLTVKEVTEIDLLTEADEDEDYGA